VLETLKSARTRTVLLNATLFILFGFAWTSDRWPEFATASLLAACALVAVEIALLFKFSRRDGHDAADKSKLVEAAKTWEPADVRTVLPITSPNDEALRDALYSEIFQSQSQALRALQRHRALVLHEAHHKHLTDYLLRWTTAHSREARYKILSRRERNRSPSTSTRRAREMASGRARGPSVQHCRWGF